MKCTDKNCRTFRIMHCDAEIAQSTNKTKTTWQLINRDIKKPNNRDYITIGENG